MINYKLKINFQDTKTLTSDICFVSGDVGAYKFTFEFFDCGKKVDVSDCVLTVRAKRADGKIIEGAGEITDGVAVFVPKNSMFAVPGELYMEIALTTKEKKYITTKIIAASVIEGLGNKTVVSNDEVSVFVTLLNQVQGRIEEVNRLVREGLPVRGVDYWTPEDRMEMADDVAEDVSPKIYDGEWWVYDSTTKSMAPSGIKAEGVDGYTPQKGVDYFDGEQGIKGDKGDTGADGYSPVKGVDYYTEEEKTEFINEVSKDSSAKYANALKGSVSGYSVRVDDVSPVEHDLGVKLVSKNILNPNTRITPKTQNGLTIQYLPDEDCYLLNGTTNVSNSFYYIDSEEIFIDGVVTLKTEAVSGSIDNPNNDYAVFYIGGRDNANEPAKNNWASVNISGNDVVTSKTTRKYLSGTWFYISSGVTFNNYKVKIQIEKGSVVTDYTPYVDVSKVTLKAQGKNLIPYPYATGTTTINGVTFTDNGDGTITVNGTATADAVFKSKQITIEPNTYTLSGCPKGGSASTYFLQFRGYRRDEGNSEITTVNKEWTNCFEIVIKSGTTVNNLIFKPQFELGIEATEYETYNGFTEYSMSAEGTIEGVKSIYPTTTLLTDTQGVLIDCEYNRDTNKVIEKLTNAIISLGGNV